MRIVIGGASGMIGTALQQELRARGDEAIALVRRPARRPEERTWSPGERSLDPEHLAGADAVVNLSGASLSKLPWTRAYREEILNSRVDATATLTSALRTLAEAGDAVPTFVSGSAVGIYGDRPGETLDERSVRGDGFLADVVDRWEREARSAPAATRLALIRTGIVMGDGGAGRVLRRIARVGLAGPIGPGTQHWPWVSLRDEVAAIIHLIDGDREGVVNAVGPEPATAADIVRAVAGAAHRPYWAPLPAPIVSGVLGTGGREMLLSDQRTRPAVLESTGFEFKHHTIEAAIRSEWAPRA